MPREFKSPLLIESSTIARKSLWCSAAKPTDLIQGINPEGYAPWAVVLTDEAIDAVDELMETTNLRDSHDRLTPKLVVSHDQTSVLLTVDWGRIIGSRWLCRWDLVHFPLLWVERLLGDKFDAWVAANMNPTLSSEPLQVLQA